LPEGHPDAEKEIGNELLATSYIGALVAVFREVKRVLRDDGILLVNLGDSYASSSTYNAPRSMHSEAGWKQAGVSPNVGRFDGKPKDLVMIPARVAMALQADGWWLRSQMPWIKRSCMPESVTDRPSSAVEYVYLLTKQEQYFWDAEDIRRPAAYPPGGSHPERAKGFFKGKNATKAAREESFRALVTKRNFRNSDLFLESLNAPHGLIADNDGNPLALDVNPMPLAEAHFASFPPRLIEPLIRAATSERGACPHCGAPHVRIVTKGAPDEAHKAACGADANGGYNGQSSKGHAAAGVQDASAVKARILSGMRERISAWRQSCACPPADPVPCVALDCFAGAGTTLMVADRLGRDSVGIELNQDYCAMIERRIVKDAGMFADITQDAV
jgi:DNA modification methylase